MTTRNHRGRATKEQAEALQRTYGDMEVRDADNALRVTLLPQDRAAGKPNDPAHCQLAQACRREFGSEAVVFFRRYAYVDVKGDDGVRRVERFFLSDAAQAVVRAFDLGEDTPEDGRMLTLLPPTPGTRLEHKRVRDRERRQAMRDGTYTPAKRKRAKRSRSGQPEAVKVRSGKGQWQMHVAEAASHE